MTITARVKTRQHGRPISAWTCSDDRDFQENIAQLRFGQTSGIDALTDKLALQESAIAAFCVYYRINKRAELWNEGGEAAS